MGLDYDAVARDLVRAVRGKRSQTAFARRVGVKPNTVYTWEAGRRSPAASTFLAAAAKVGHDVREAVRGFLLAEPAWIADRDPATPEGVAALLADLRGDAPIGQIATRAVRSRFAVSRWLSGQAEPRLPELLRMVDATSLRALDFVARFADPRSLPSTAVDWERLDAARRVARSDPWTSVLRLSLELAPYRDLPGHDAGWLAGRLGLPRAQVEESLVLLESAGQIRWDGSHYAPVEVLALDVRGPRGSTLKAFWLDVSRARLDDGGLYSYNIASVSAADLERLEEMQRAHYRAVRSLVAASAPAERLVLLQLQLVPLDRSPP